MSLFFSFILLVLFLTVQPAFSETYSESVTDKNFALCKGVGLHATGNIQIRVDYTKNSGSFEVNDFLLIGKYKTASHFSGELFFLNEKGKELKISLQKPWYPAISEPDSFSLTNPQILSSARPGVDDKQKFIVGKSGQINIKSNSVHSVDGGNCPASFEHKITLK